MNEILWNLINTGAVRSFIDDVIVGKEEEEENDEVVEKVMKRLAENNLYVKLEKCKWKVREVEFLEVVIGLEGIKMEEEKMKRVLYWLTPKEVKNIQKFLELANYYQQFIKDFSVIARLLYNLMKKDQNQTERQKKVFQELNERFTKELVTAAPNLDKKMKMKVDILNYATGEVLSMKYKDRKQKPIVYLSKSLNKTERNYEIHNKKMLVVIRELENWKHLLESTKFNFKIWIDYKKLEYFMKAQQKTSLLDIISIKV